MESQKLRMSFDPHTIEHLGVKMYSVLPNAIAELIANAYDAEAQNVHISLQDSGETKRISIIDDGIGMTFDEINNKFLRIGRKRRDDDNGLSPTGMRKVTGRKGLGKLAFFGIGDTIEIITKKEGQCVTFTLSWSELMNCKTSNYEPRSAITSCDITETGTTIALSELKRNSSFDKLGLAVSLSKLFNFFDDSFKVDITHNNDEPLSIDNQLKYQNLDKQIEWNFPNNNDVKNEFLDKNNVAGCIIATEKPLKPGLRGITLFAHGRLVNAPEFFGVGESSHVYSYLTGWLNVDFVDEMTEDVISTDRQSLNWDLPVTTELQNNLKELLKKIERNWREKRKVEKRKRVTKKTNIDLQNWYTTLSDDIQTNVEQIVDTVVDDSELSDDKQSEVVQILHTLIPEYAKYHWRHLHSTVKDASYNDYQHSDYYRAVEEAIKRYVVSVQEKSNETADGQDLMMKVFGTLSDSKKKNGLSVSSKYKRTDGSDFSHSTQFNIEEGQKFLSAGVMSGVRNPLAHEEIEQLKITGLFTESDCLDILSLLSHLFRRLDDAQVINYNPPTN